ncbi:MAG: NAD-dependent dehydratase, partial [Nocardioidaceae bacterium]|nr:NAD-dependent dehydratase [Nocardioidaceae bacterium]
DSVERGDIPRDDVAAVLLAVLEAPDTSGKVLELVGGDDEVGEAVAAA